MRTAVVLMLLLAGCRGEIIGPGAAVSSRESPRCDTATDEHCGEDVDNAVPSPDDATTPITRDSGARPVNDSGAYAADTGSKTAANDASEPSSGGDAGANPTTPNDAGGDTAVKPDRKLGTMISLGDSITVGHNGGYQLKVQNLLDAAKIEYDADIINDGHSGWQAIKCNVDGIYQILDADLPKFKPDTVLLMIGTNDIGGGNSPNINLSSIGHPEVNCSWDDTPKRVSIVIDKIHQLRPTAMVFVSNVIPIARASDVEQSSAKYAPKVAAMVNQRIANGDKLVRAVDVWTGFPRDNGFQDDKVHPTNAGQDFIGTRFYEQIKGWLDGK